MKKDKNQKPDNRWQQNRADHRTRKLKRAHVWLKVLPHEHWLKVRRGQTIWEALHRAGVPIESDCGGLGRCGKCKVQVHTAIGPPSREAKALLHEEELKQGVRLACRTRIEKDLTVTVGEMEAGEDYIQILKTGDRPPIELDPLLQRKYVSLPSVAEREGMSSLDRIKLALGPEYKDLAATLYSLHQLPAKLSQADSQGAIVLHGDRLLAWQQPSKMGQMWGLVFDLGTSTVVGKLINMVDGTEVAAVSRLNSQMRFGSNVISRLQYIQQHPNSLGYFQSLLIKDMNGIAARLLEVTGVETADVFAAIAAGNTTMQHLLLGLSPLGIAEAPFTPVLTDGLVARARDLGLRLNPGAPLYVMPMQSAYIGGDLLSVLLASGAAEQDDGIVLGLDLGTNGEIFLGNRKKVMTCSAAAGPAFEGASISRGMIAAAGAIEGVSIENGGLRYDIIGNIKPRGVCGSGLVDLVAVLLHLGFINNAGLIHPSRHKPGQELASRLRRRSGLYAFQVASAEESYDGRAIYLTQKDVRELQLAKAAISAGIQILMDDMGVELRDIQHIYLAGALGNYVDPLSAMRIGLLPPVDPSMVSSLGNAATTGAFMALLSRHYWRLANELSDSIEHVELSYRTDYNSYFVERMDFPEADIR